MRRRRAVATTTHHKRKREGSGKSPRVGFGPRRSASAQPGTLVQIHRTGIVGRIVRHTDDAGTAGDAGAAAVFLQRPDRERVAVVGKSDRVAEVSSAPTFEAFTYACCDQCRRFAVDVYRAGVVDSIAGSRFVHDAAVMPVRPLSSNCAPTASVLPSPERATEPPKLSPASTRSPACGFEASQGPAATRCRGGAGVDVRCAGPAWGGVWGGLAQAPRPRACCRRCSKRPSCRSCHPARCSRLDIGLLRPSVPVRV